MASTPASLLMRLRSTADPVQWDRLFKLYGPLLIYWVRRTGVSIADSEDVVQEVFVVLIRTLPTFEYDRTKGFRKWLRTMTVNKSRDHLRRVAKNLVQQHEEAVHNHVAPNETDPFWEVEYREYIVRRLLDVMKSEFQPSSWQACWKCTVEGKSAVEVAEELNMTPGAVRAAKFRVLAALRSEMAGLLE